MKLEKYLTENNTDYKDFAKKIGLKYVNGLYKYLSGLQKTIPTDHEKYR